MRRPGAAPQALAALVSEFAADPEMADIVRAFVAGLPAQLEVLAEAARSADLTTLTRLSHQLKGAAGGYGFPSITEAAAKLEQAAQGGDPAQVQSALATVVALCDRTRPDCPEVVPAASEAPPALLAIDDSPQIQALIEARLRAEGITIHKALDAREGLQMTREHMPDLVLLDLDLPDGSGLDVCRELKADPHTASIPIVFLTGASDAATKAAALDLGAVDYVTKPFDAIELRARVRSALRTKRYHDLLASRAQLDGLTRLWNRAFFDGRLAEEQTSAMRHGRPLSVAMLDVDHFKRVNDTFGHPVGDQVLQRVASALRKAVRGNDVVCRYGGEEFALILRDTAQRAASDASERLRAAVAAVQLVVRGQRVAITASFGVASTDRAPERHVGLADALVGAADAALYRAKRAGRNRVVSVTIDG